MCSLVAQPYTQTTDCFIAGHILVHHSGFGVCASGHMLSLSVLRETSIAVLSKLVLFGTPHGSHRWGGWRWRFLGERVAVSVERGRVGQGKGGADVVRLFMSWRSETLGVGVVL